MGLLSKVLATLLALNMAFMLALPIGVFADDFVNNGVTDVTYEEDLSTTPLPTEPDDTSIGGAGAIPLGDGTPSASPTEGEGEFGVYSYPFDPAGTTQNVTTWAQFWAAWNDANVSTIVLQNNITRDTTTNNASAGNRLTPLNRSLKVTSSPGNTFNLSLGTGANAENRFNIADWTSAQAAAGNPRTLGFYNVNIGRDAASTSTGYYLFGGPNATYSGGWIIVLSNVSNGGTSSASGIVNLPGAEIVYDENVTWNRTGTTGQSISITSRVQITAGATVNLTNPDNTVIDILGAHLGGSYFRAAAGAVVNLTNTHPESNTTGNQQQCIWFHDIRNGDKFEVDGAILTGVSNGSAATGDDAGVYNFNSGNDTRYNFEVNVTGGGKVYGTSTGRMAAFTINVNGATFNLRGEGSLLELTSSRGYVDYQATLRLRDRANQTFNVSDYAVVRVTKQLNSGTSTANGFGEVAAIRFGDGGNNAFNVTTGGKVYVETWGNGTPTNPGTPAAGVGGENVAIESAAGNFQFNVSGEDSIISLIAWNGAAFNAGSQGNIKVNISNGANFKAWGRTADATAGATAGIFRATGTGTGTSRTEFTMTEPRYYDFRNIRPGGGRIFNVSADAWFTSTNSNLSVWTHGSDLEGDPYATWWKTSYGLSGANFNTVRISSPDYPGFAAQYRDATYYSRMSANNATPYLDPITDLTNADKSVRAFAHVPEGIDSIGRFAWTNEIWGNFVLNGTTQLPYRSYQSETVYSVQTGAATLNGVLKYNNVNTATNNFLVPGDQYSLAKDAWRGPEGQPEHGYAAKASDIPDGYVPVRDVTPPDRVTVTGPLWDHRFDATTYTGTIWDEAKSVEGTYPNMATGASAAWNGEAVESIYAVVKHGATVSGPYPAVLNTTARTWSIDLSAATLVAGDTIHIIAVDTTGNENPLEATAFRDTTFPAATKLTVEVFPVDLDANVKWIGLTEAQRIQSGIATDGSASTPSAEMIKLIGATATGKPGSPYPPPYTLQVLDTPNGWGTAPNFKTEIFTTPAFGTATKTYTITYTLTSTPVTYSKTVLVHVYPKKFYIEADPIYINTFNATEVLALSATARDSKFIELANATACLGVDSITGEPSGDWSPANVDVLGYDLTPSHGYVGSVTFAVKSDHTKTLTVPIYVSTPPTPVLNVSNPIVIWSKSPTDPERPPGSFTPAEFGALGGKAGSARTTDEWMYGVEAFDAPGAGAADITDAVLYEGQDSVRLTETGIYTVKYSVTSSGITVDAYRTILVNITPFGDYVLLSRSFVARDDAGALPPGTGPIANAANIVGTLGTGFHGDSETYGYKMSPGVVGGLTEVPVSVFSNTNGYGAGAVAGTYPITVAIPETLGLAAPLQAKVNIVARIANKDELTPRQPATTPALAFDYTYAIGANDVFALTSDAGNLSGDTPAAHQRLISAALATGWKLDAQRINNANTEEPQLMVVAPNTIPSTVVAGSSYDVTFAVVANPAVTVTVKFIFGGTPPVITFEADSAPGTFDGGSPLVLEKQATSTPLTAAALKAKMTVYDNEDGNLINDPKLIITDPATGAFPVIDQMNVGVYRVKYYVTDNDGMDATAYRAVVVTDGRYIFNRSDGPDGIIIGAQDFVTLRTPVTGQYDQIRSWSFAEAYKIGGTSDWNLTPYLTIPDIPPTYVAQAPVGDYGFTWRVTGVSGYSTGKPITGHVVDATDVSAATKNNPYAVAAKTFTVNPIDAAGIISGNSYIAAANARAWNLVPALPVPTVVLLDNASFSTAEGDYYPIRFGISVSGTTQPAPPNQAQVHGIVAKGNLPDLQVTRPYQVVVGGSFTPMAPIVAATDVEDTVLGIPLDIKYNLTSAVPGTDPNYYTAITTNPVNTSNIGLTSLKYWVFDSDGNFDVQQRVVVVNDGSYVIGTTSNKGNNSEGRILYARSFVIKSTDVISTPDASRNSQITSLSTALVFNGSTAADLGSAGVSVVNPGSYSPSVGNHTITLQTSDVPSGVIQKNIIGKVVNANVLAPSTPPVRDSGPVTYVYGNTGVTKTLAEAASIVSGGDSGLLSALGAEAVIASPGIPNDSMVATNVKVVSVTKGGVPTAFAAELGSYVVTVSDVGNKQSIQLTINVGTHFPTIVIDPNYKPYEITLVGTPGNISDAVIRSNVTASDPVDGNLTSYITYTIYNEAGAVVTSIPQNVAAIYRVVYTVSNTDGQTATESRAIFINDGRYVYDAQYVLEARSFVIGDTDVSSAASPQILTYSQAHAWTSSGEAATVEVRQVAGYTNIANDYAPRIGVSGSTLTKDITARVFLKGENLNQGQGTNGNHYALRADNFRINITDANALKTNYTATYASTFVTKSGAVSLDRTSSSLVVQGTASLATNGDGAFRTTTFALPGTAGYPTKVPITFWVDEDHTTTVTVFAIISNAGPPQIQLPATREIWVGPIGNPDVPRTPGSYLPSEFNYITSGPVTATDDFDVDINTKLKYGNLADWSDRTSFVENAAPIDFINVAPGYYQVAYSVTDSDFNTTTVIDNILVNDGSITGGVLQAYNLVTTVKQITASANFENLVLQKSFARAWERLLEPDGSIFMNPIAPRVDSLGSFAPVAHPGYDVIIGVTSGGVDYAKPIKAKVLDKDHIDQGTETSKDKYVVAANDVLLFPAEALAYRGAPLNAAAKQNIITAALGEGYVINGTGTAGGLGTTYVDVYSSELTAGVTPSPGDTFKVVLFPVGVTRTAGVPDVKIEITITINNGTSPEIAFTKVPLVFEQGTGFVPDDATGLRSYLIVTDVEDNAASIPVGVVVTLYDESGSVVAAIDRAKIGVYKAKYTATDTHGNKTEATRAVVITDGRYVIKDSAGADITAARTGGILGDNEVILGARGFLIKQSDVVAERVAILSRSYAEAFDSEGNKISLIGANAQPVLESIPAGYTTATAAAGEYTFTWRVTGKATTKPIIGTVVVADVVDPGTKDSQYGVYASNFQVNRVDAAAIIASGNAGYYAAANAHVVKLVAAAPNKDVVMFTNGGFSTTQAAYNLVFGIQDIPQTVQSAPIVGTVTDGTPPELSAPEINIWVGPAAEKQAGAIEPSEYDILLDVYVHDEEDAAAGTDLTLADVTATYDAATPWPAVISEETKGRYLVHFEVTDSDHNTSTASRVVIINDGTYVPGFGNTLRVNPFVIKRSDVQVVSTPPDPYVYVDQQLRSNSGLALFHNETNAVLSIDQTWVTDRGGYTNVVAVYNVSFAGRDVDRSTVPETAKPNLTKTVQAEVVDVNKLVTSPGDFDKTNYFIFGNDNTVILTAAQAQAIVDAADSSAALVTALSAGSRKTNGNGTLTQLVTVAPTVTNSFYTKTFHDGTAPVAASMGSYTATVRDADSKITTTLTFQVGEGSFPVIKFGDPPVDTREPAPVLIPLSDDPTPITEAKLRELVSATDAIDGDITDDITFVGGVPVIPGNVTDVYEVTYTVTNSAMNSDTKSRAVIIGEGVTVGQHYLLGGLSFVVAHEGPGGVDMANKADQIISKSNARAWTITGESIDLSRVTVKNDAGYTNSADVNFRIQLGVLDEASLTREITAKVYKYPSTVGENGTRYSITADHFRVNVHDANLLIAQTDAQVAAEFLSNTRAAVKSYKRSGSMDAQDGTKVMTSDGGFKAHGAFTNADEGTVFPVTFWVSEDHTATVTVNLTVSNALPPTIHLPGIREVWIGDPSDPERTPGSYLPSTLNYITSGPVYASDDVDSDAYINARLKYGRLTNWADKSTFVEDAAPINFATVNRENTPTYPNVPVAYTVTDSDFNTTTVVDWIVVNDGSVVIKGDYEVQSYHFVATSDQVAAAGASKDALILNNSYSRAWVKIDMSDGTFIWTPISPRVVDDGLFSAFSGSYNIKIGAVEQAGHPDGADIEKPIKGTVTDKTHIDQGTESSNNKYAVAGNDAFIELSTATQYRGLSDAAKVKILEATLGEGYVLTGTSTVGGEGLTYVDVLSNTFTTTTTPSPGDEFTVVLYPRGVTTTAGVPDVKIELKLTISKVPPSIIFTADPLVVPWTANSVIMDQNALKASSIATDSRASVITSAMTATPVSGGTIDTSHVGVYLVNYYVKDADNLDATAQRYVVVNDGRYSILDENSDGKNDVIIGARSFLVSRALVTGGADQVRSLSYAEAFDNNFHTELLPYLPSGLPTTPFAWVANATPATYDFTWAPVGHPTATKAIQGTVSEADIVDPGTKDSKYGLEAWHFTVTEAEANAIVTNADSTALIIAKAQAHVIQLIASNPDPVPAVRIVDRGGFTDVQGVYQIQFGAVGQPVIQPKAIINATVTSVPLPVLTVKTPIEVWIGAPGDPLRPTGSITPAEYSDEYEVTANSSTDGDLIAAGGLGVTYGTPALDLLKAGTYAVHYTATDSRGQSVSADRVVAVHAGQIDVGVGRILEATPFVISANEVETSTALAISEQLKAKALVALINGTTNANLGSSQITVSSNGGYTNVAGDYQVTFTAPDDPATEPALSKTVTVRVIDQPVNPGPDILDPFEEATYTYGQHITVNETEMAALIATGDSAVLTALEAGATITRANGTVDTVAVKVVDYNGKPLALVPGRYNVTVSDVNDKYAIVLHIDLVPVGEHAPVIDAPYPVVVERTAATGNLTWADLMDGTYRPKSDVAWHVTASDVEDGIITSSVEIIDPATGVFPVIPRNVADLYTVVYRVTDTSGLTDEQSRTVIVDDGNTEYDERYALRAASFLIGTSEVDTANAASQILVQSNAKAKKSDGSVVTTYVREVAGYTNVAGDYRPIVGISGYSPLFKTITAHVFDDGDGPGGGGGTNGSVYSIEALNFRINLADANALKAAPSPGYEDAFITRSSVASYLRNDSSLPRGGTPVVTNTSTFRTATFAAPGDPGYPTRIPITFHVFEEPTTTVTIYAIVSNGSYPEIAAPVFKNVDLNSTFGEAQYLDGVTAYDNEDGDLTTYVTHDNNIDTSKEGPQRINYAVTDFEGNAATGYTWVLVGGHNGVFALDFVRNAANVTATPGSAQDNEILEASHAKAYTVDLTDPSGTLIEITPTVKSTGGYTNAEGEYDIVIGATSAPGVAPPIGDPALPITGKVIDKELITTVEEDDGEGTDITDGNDEDLDDPDNQSRYVVASAKQVYVRYSEVSRFVGLGPVAKASIIDAAGAEGYRIDTSGTYSHDVDVTVNPIPAGAIKGQSFYVTLIAKGVPSVWAKVRFTIYDGNLPVLIVGNPLEVAAIDTAQEMTRTELMVGVSASDIEDGVITNKVVITDPATGLFPRIDKSVVGIYQVHYSVTDDDENEVHADRAIFVNDGRYIPITDPGDPAVITHIIGSKNFVIRQAEVSTVSDDTRITQAKALSWVEVYDSEGNSLIASVDGTIDNAVDYAAKVTGEYTFTWVLSSDPLVTKTNTGTVVPDEYRVDPGDKNSRYAIIAKDFTVNKTEASTITAGPAYVSHADARVYSLLNTAPPLTAQLVDNGGFHAENGTYKVTFGEAVPNNKLSVIINGVVGDHLPVLSYDKPIVVARAAAGSSPVDQARIITAGHVTAMDSEAVSASNPTGDITSYVVITDLNSGGAPSFPADQNGVYPISIAVTDSDGNTVTEYVAVVIDQIDPATGNTVNYVIDKGFILGAHNFEIALADVSTVNPIAQIREQGEVEAWRYDGVRIPASVVSTDGYRDTAGIYRPVVGVYDSGLGYPPTIITSPAISKVITVTVRDANRIVVTFNANGGTLVGPSRITVVEPATTLPYMPASPIRDGYNFRFWSSSATGGSQFTPDMTLTGDLTLYAQWTQIPVVVTPPPPTPIVNITNPAPQVTVTPEGNTIIVQTEPTPTAAPTPTPTPVPEPETPEVIVVPTWSLFDLLATILAVLLLVVFFIKFFFDRPKDEAYEEEPIDAQLWAAMTPEQRAQYQARRESDYQAWLSDQQRTANKPKALFVNAPVLLIAAAALVESLIMLFTTQVFSGAMVIVDDWSVIFALILFVQLLSPMVAAAIRNNGRANQQQQFAAQPAAGPGNPVA